MSTVSSYSKGHSSCICYFIYIGRCQIFKLKARPSNTIHGSSTLTLDQTLISFRPRFLANNSLRISSLPKATWDVTTFVFSRCPQALSKHRILTGLTPSLLAGPYILEVDRTWSVFAVAFKLSVDLLYLCFASVLAGSVLLNFYRLKTLTKSSKSASSTWTKLESFFFKNGRIDGYSTGAFQMLYFMIELLKEGDNYFLSGALGFRDSSSFISWISLSKLVFVYSEHKLLNMFISGSYLHTMLVWAPLLSNPFLFRNFSLDLRFMAAHSFFRLLFNSPFLYMILSYVSGVLFILYSSFVFRLLDENFLVLLTFFLSSLSC